MPENFALTGAAGYVAPRHLQAIQATGNRLVAALDPHDSVGILDRYFPDCAYFREPERFDRHIEKLRRAPAAEPVDYVSICSPNYLHDAHIRLALRTGAHAICEKPLVLNPWNCDALQELEAETGRKVYTVLQLRLHPSVLALKRRIAAEPPGRRHQVTLRYITARGRWYLFSWKGDEEKSGGLVTNIGIHFFDMLLWIFGGVVRSEVVQNERTRAGGRLELEKASVDWFLSIEREDLPAAVREEEGTTFRAITVDGDAFEFSGGFADLHTRVYEEILAGRGCGIEAARPSIDLVRRIRDS
jgi:UDP-N-acetyl-2-amino-2-deoxyglucuronate dehydrogenase